LTSTNNVNIEYPATWYNNAGYPAAIVPLGEGRKPSPLGEDFSRPVTLMKKYRKTSTQCI
jgi:hypothetical protein